MPSTARGPFLNTRTRPSTSMPFGSLMVGHPSRTVEYFNHCVNWSILVGVAKATTKPRVEPATEAWQLCMELFGENRPRMLDIQAEYGLKPPQFFALQALDEPVPMSSVANVLRCDRSAVTWITDRLEERGYVERRADAHD